MKKIVFILLLFVLSLFTISSASYAQSDEFDTILDATYNFKDDGTIVTEMNISVRNLSTEKFLRSFALKLNSENYKNIDVRQNKIPIPFDLEQNSGLTSIKISFPDKIVGRDKKREFSISFESIEFASKIGKTWDITLPKIFNESIFDNTNHKLFIPASYGQLASIYPKPSVINNNEEATIIEFTDQKGDIVNATFGIYQVYSFDITYHLENPLNQISQQIIAIIPDTLLQKVYYTDIDPKPASIERDKDGNWLANFNLEPRQKIDVRTTGQVQLLSEATREPIISESLEEYTKPDKYWESDNKKIKELAAVYNTPKKIYDYVVSTLNYNYQKVTPTVHRLGAVEALQNSDNAICMEFTDTFIAIARAAGIPAREINGYAYTSNPNLQPLSLVADVLHSWPQFWDSSTNRWVEVDPTWENTTGGINYFDNHDLKHITFVIHGKSSENPYPPGSYKLGSIPQKDVFVSFSQLPKKKNSTTSLSLVSKSISLSSGIYKFKLENHGPAAIYDKQLDIFFDETQTQSIPVSILPPFASYEFEISVPVSFWSNNFPDNIKVVFQDQQILVPTQKQNVMLIKYFAIFTILLISILFLLIKIKHKK